VVDSITNETVSPFETPISVVIIDLGYGAFALDILKAIAKEANADVKFLTQAPLSGTYGAWCVMLITYINTYLNGIGD
jgi:hypothetical protein